MTITVHSTPTCVQCHATERHADAKGIPVEIVDLSEHPDLAAAFKRRGLAQAPVGVVTDDNGIEIDHWTGFNPDKLNGYVAVAA